MKTSFSKTLMPSLVACAGCVVLNAQASAQHADVSPYIQNSKIVTGAWQDGPGTFTPSARTFGYDFGEDPLDPYFIADPGINARPSNNAPVNFPSGASSLVPGATLRFDLKVVHTALGTPNSGNHTLLYWDGSDLNADVLIDESDVNFVAPPGNGSGLFESLRMNFGSKNATAGVATGNVTGFVIDTAEITPDPGEIHDHLNSFLNSFDNEVDPTDLVNAPEGIYLVQLTLGTNASGIAESEPIWFVFNNGLDEGVHDAALDWVGSTVVPEPGVIGLLGIAIPMLLRRRRRA